jgi:hypothetical protein
MPQQRRSGPRAGVLGAVIQSEDNGTKVAVSGRCQQGHLGITDRWNRHIHHHSAVHRTRQKLPRTPILGSKPPGVATKNTVGPGP